MREFLSLKVSWHPTPNFTFHPSRHDPLTTSLVCISTIIMPFPTPLFAVSGASNMEYEYYVSSLPHVSLLMMMTCDVKRKHGLSNNMATMMDIFPANFSYNV